MSSWRLNQHGKSFGFGLSALRKYPEIVPMVTIVSGVVVFVSSACIYFATKKLDVQITGQAADCDKMDLSKPHLAKVFQFKQEVKPNPELQQLLKEIHEK